MLVHDRTTGVLISAHKADLLKEIEHQLFQRHHVHLRGGSRLLAAGDTGSQRGITPTPQKTGGNAEQTTEMPETGLKFSIVLFAIYRI
jgi:hypothetical protein